MDFRVAGATDAEIVMGTDMVHQLIGMLKGPLFTGRSGIGDVAAQCHDILNAAFLQQRKLLLQRSQIRAYAGEVSQCGDTHLALQFGGQGSGVGSGAAGSTVSDAHKRGF